MQPGAAHKASSLAGQRIQKLSGESFAIPRRFQRNTFINDGLPSP